jgi:hypothetical protein
MITKRRVRLVNSMLLARWQSYAERLDFASKASQKALDDLKAYAEKYGSIMYSLPE